jgi:prepilin-type N-terminal cleavage/methylation domain-containing protein
VKRKSKLSILRETCGGVCVERLTNRLGAWPKRRYKTAFTLIELLIVIAVIVVLAGLILSTFGYVQKKGARARAETEIAAMSAACESYKADNGIYPRGNANLSNTTPYDTDNLDARTNLDPSAAVYSATSLFLYEQLAGVTSGSRSAIPTGKTYFTFKANMLLPAPPSTADITAICDPFGNSYGYSTIANPMANPSPTPGAGYNPTFDLWSTAGTAPSPTPTPPATQQDLWIKNW